MPIAPGVGAVNATRADSSPAPSPGSEAQIAAALVRDVREQMDDYDGRSLAVAVCEKIAFVLRRRLPAIAGAGSLLDFEQLVIDACAHEISKLVEADFHDAVDTVLWSIEDLT
jgi:hypothetical protein